MPLLIPTISITLLSFVSSSNAQTFRRRRSLTSRIIAGIVVGVICLILISIFVCMMLRRRRARRGTTVPGFTGVTSKPLFGGPWGRHNEVPRPPQHQAYGAQPQTPYGGIYNSTPQNAPQQQYNPEYPPATSPAPPPPYGKQESTGFSAPPGSPPNNGSFYAPPPGPPPPAHTTGQENSFVGGFRS